MKQKMTFDRYSWPSADGKSVRKGRRTMKKTRSAIRIPMPLRYLINLVLILALSFVLTPERLMDMTVAEFEAVQPDEADAHAIGRLITSTTWYYACVVPANELSDVEEGFIRFCQR